MGVPSNPIVPFPPTAKLLSPVARRAAHWQPPNLKCETSNNNNNVGNCDIIVIIVRINMLHFSQIDHCNGDTASLSRRVRCRTNSFISL